MAGGSRRCRRAARDQRAAARRVGGGVGRPVEGAVARVLEGVPQGVHGRREVGQLVEVLLAERLELARALLGEAQAHDAEVVVVLAARDQPGLLGAIDEPDRAVMAQHEVAGDVADGRSARVVMTADGEQQLVLGRGEARGLGVLLAPAQEPAQTGAQLEEPPVVLVGGRGAIAGIVAPRDGGGGTGRSCAIQISRYDIV